MGTSVISPVSTALSNQALCKSREGIFPSGADCKAKDSSCSLEQLAGEDGIRGNDKRTDQMFSSGSRTQYYPSPITRRGYN